MSVAAVRAGMSTVEFLETCRRRMKTQNCLPSDAADALLNLDLLSPDAIYELARAGAIAILGDGLHEGRRADSHRAARPSGRHSGEAITSLLEQIWLRAADGRSIPIGDFSVADWETLKTTARDQSRGWKRKESVATFALSLLASAKVELTSELSAEKKTALAEKAMAAWS